MDARVANLSGRHKIRRERHEELRECQEHKDQAFFVSMRNEGSMGASNMKQKLSVGDNRGGGKRKNDEEK